MFTRFQEFKYLELEAMTPPVYAIRTSRHATVDKEQKYYEQLPTQDVQLSPEEKNVTDSIHCMNPAEDKHIQKKSKKRKVNEFLD